MQIYTGTSGWNYDAWKGNFYPDDVKKKDWLQYYGSQLSACEVNNTFYRIPKSAVVEGWAAAVPENFRFVLKCSRRVTHFARLKETGDESFGFMWRAAQKLGDRRGPLLFQLPPNAKADVERLKRFLGTLAPECQAVFEFRHESWVDDAVHSALREHGAALCWVDNTDDADGADDASRPDKTGGTSSAHSSSDDEGANASSAAQVATADFGYLRLRRAEYSLAELDAWAERIRAQGWTEAYVFFKHEEDGAPPASRARSPNASPEPRSARHVARPRVRSEQRPNSSRRRPMSSPQRTNHADLRNHRRRSDQLACSSPGPATHRRPSPQLGFVAKCIRAARQLDGVQCADSGQRLRAVAHERNARGHRAPP